MRVLILTEEPITFSGTMVRGGQIQVRNVVQGLRERGHDVYLIDWNSSPEVDYQHSVDPASRFVEGPMRTFRKAVKIGASESIDIVISKTRKTYFPGYLAGKVLKKPHVVHVGSSLERPGRSIRDLFEQLSVESRLRIPHEGYFVVCEMIGDQLKSRGVDERRIFNVKNAVETARFSPDADMMPLNETVRKALDSVDQNVFRLGYIGGLHEFKGLLDLSYALHESSEEFHAIVAGDGPDRSVFEQCFSDNGTFLGAVPYDQIPALYQEFDAFVLPSHTEGLPRVVLEAQAAGVPVIATKVGGIPEIIEAGQTGLLVEPGQPKRLREQIESLESDPELQEQLSVGGREFVTSKFRWENLYDRYEDAFQDLVNS